MTSFDRGTSYNHDTSWFIVTYRDLSWGPGSSYGIARGCMHSVWHIDVDKAQTRLTTGVPLNPLIPSSPLPSSPLFSLPPLPPTSLFALQSALRYHGLSRSFTTTRLCPCAKYNEHAGPKRGNKHYQTVSGSSVRHQIFARFAFVLRSSLPPLLSLQTANISPLHSFGLCSSMLLPYVCSACLQLSEDVEEALLQRCQASKSS